MSASASVPASEAQELKQQGAIEAAQNPESSVTAEDAQQQMVEQSKNAGIPAFKFDPDASPEEKRAQAQAVSLPRLSSRPHGTPIKSIHARSSSHYHVPKNNGN